MKLYKDYLEKTEKFRGITMKNGTKLNETLAEAIYYYLENEWGYKDVKINNVQLTISPRGEIIYLIDYTHIKNGKIINNTSFYSEKQRKKYNNELINTHIACITDLEYKPWKD